jgi:YggT family protein
MRVDAPPLLRYLVFAAFVLAALVALGSWLVRTRRVSPFGGLGRALRSLTDPVMRPVERGLVRRGGNPVQAGWWLVIGVAIVGVIVLGLADWLYASFFTLTIRAQQGPRALLGLTVQVAYDVLFLAILVRVVGSWIGVGRYHRWMRPCYWLTDWLIEPIRRVLPSMGMFDWSPLVALLVLWLLKAFLDTVLGGR